MTGLGPLNAVAYAAYESHANYYEETPLMVYAYQNLTYKGACPPAALAALAPVLPSLLR